MKCPACSSQLSRVSTAGIELDICSEACGGVWFDAGELEKLECADDNTPRNILRPLRNQNVAVDRMKKRSCPKCEGVMMNKVVSDAYYDVEIDACSQCSGIWLDMGEWEELRKHHTDVASRQKIIDKYSSVSASGGEPPQKLKAVLQLLFH